MRIFHLLYSPHPKRVGFVSPIAVQWPRICSCAVTAHGGKQCEEDRTYGQENKSKQDKISKATEGDQTPIDKWWRPTHQFWCQATHSLRKTDPTPAWCGVITDLGRSEGRDADANINLPVNTQSRIVQLTSRTSLRIHSFQRRTYCPTRRRISPCGGPCSSI